MLLKLAFFLIFSFLIVKAMLVLLDNGHGGLINGIYQTPGKRSPIWADGKQLFEGEFNRAIVSGIIQELTLHKVPYVNLVPEHEDVSLYSRVARANNYSDEPCFLVSVHANAGGGRGWEVYTTPGETQSDRLASVFGHTFELRFPYRRLRADWKDGDLDKEAGFYVLTHSAMPAILTENFFMDNPEECQQILMTREGRSKIVDLHVESILSYINSI